MKTRIEQIWDEEVRSAAALPVGKDGFKLTRINHTSSFDIYAGIDDSPLVVLAIGVQSRPPAIPLESASLDYFRKQRVDGSWLMVLRLKRRGLEQVFGRLCQDLADAAASVPTEALLVNLFRERLNLWIQLFHLSDDGLLRSHQIKGLIAELLVLEQLVLAGKRDLADAVGGWTGPLQADQDFVYEDISIEVKAITPGNSSVTISSLGQLECTVPLRLAVISLSKVAPGEASALTLNSLVARIETRIASSPPALDTFRKRLLEAGYVEHERYDQDWYKSLEQVTYDVTPAFPKLIRSAVPEGIDSATYSILLSRIGQFQSVTPIL